MRNLHIPLVVPRGRRLRMTQPYGDMSTLAWYREKGISFPFHNGIDLVVSDDPSGVHTYGCELACPFDKGRKVRTYMAEPMSTKGNGLVLQSQPFVEDGVTKRIEVTLWHLSEVRDEHEFREGQVVGYVGNSGAVRPEPTPECPFKGSHLHLMVYEFHQIGGRWVLQNADNGVGGAVNPLTRFDLDRVRYGEDTGAAKDAPPAEWAFRQRGITEPWQKIVFAIKNWLTKK